MFRATKPTKSRLRQYKKVKCQGMKFTIQKINPLVDFTVQNMPQIFTAFVSRRKTPDTQVVNEAVLRKNQQDIANVLRAGIVKPKVVDDDKEDGIKLNDLMSNTVLAVALYTEIVVHSLNMFRGIKGLFFSIRTRRLFYTEYAKNIRSLQLK